MRNTQEEVSIPARNEARRAKLAEALSGLKGIPFRTIRENECAREIFGKVTYTGKGGAARLLKTFQMLGYFSPGENADLESLVSTVASGYPEPEELLIEKGIGKGIVRTMKKLYTAYGLISPQEIRDGDALQEWTASWAREDERRDSKEVSVVNPSPVTTEAVLSMSPEAFFSNGSLSANALSAVLNELSRKNYATMRDFISNFSEGELLRTPNFGRKSLAELKEALRTAGLIK